MNYQIGDNVVHWTYGPGRIVATEEKELSGVSRQYYVVEVGQLTLWVPVDGTGQSSLRLPAPREEFKDQLEILNSPGEPLADNQFLRQSQLTQRMQQKTLAEVCCIIRDLINWSRDHKLNRNDISLLKRAEDLLLDEWVLSLGTPRADARSELDQLLGRI